MNVFENLIEELKEENLLERTVIEIANDNQEAQQLQSSEQKNADEIEPEIITNFAIVPDVLPVAAESNNGKGSKNRVAESDFEKSADESRADEKITAAENKDFYYERAREEIASLELVEHLTASIEREMIKIEPKPFDSLEAKKTLHDFGQIETGVDSAEYSQAEFRLLRETEIWFTALVERNRRVTVSQLRRFCENSKPPLSRKALLAMARFYRNSPYSELVRTKFELVITRLFSQELPSERRELLLSREEIVENLNDLYSEWASIPIYSTEDNESDFVLTAFKSQEYVTEIKAANSLDELIRSNFFSRLNASKESNEESFFAPMVAAAAVESNIEVGNRYIELIEWTREQTHSADLLDKWGILHEEAVSEATAKSYRLAKLLNEKSENLYQPEETEDLPAKNVLAAQPLIFDKEAAKNDSPQPQKNSSIGKRILIFAVIGIIVCALIYFGIKPAPKIENSIPKAEQISLENTFLRDYLKSASLSGKMLFGVTKPEWKTLAEDRKKEFLEKILAAGNERGFDKIHLIDEQGNTVAYADNSHPDAQ